MAERIARLYGPAALSTDASTPTTMFTVPSGELYIARLLTVITPAISGAAASSTQLYGIGSTLQDDLVFASSAAAITTAPAVSNQNFATPFVEGEILKGVTLGAFSTPTRADYDTGNNATWGTASTTDATTLAKSFTPQAMGAPTNIYWVVVNTKASAPDTITSITDAHTSPPTGIGSIISVASTSVRTSIWGGYASANPTGAAAYTVNWGGTWTTAFIDAVSVSGSALISGTPGTNNVVLQTATATGTTEASHGVTMTPTITNSWQLLVVGGTGVASSYTGPSNSTEFADGSVATPSTTAAAYFIAPSVSNPAATIASTVGLTDWSASCIEVSYGAIPTVTLSGVIID